MKDNELNIDENDINQLLNGVDFNVSASQSSSNDTGQNKNQNKNLKNNQNQNKNNQNQNKGQNQQNNQNQQKVKKVINEESLLDNINKDIEKEQLQKNIKPIQEENLKSESDSTDSLNYLPNNINKNIILEEPSNIKQDDEDDENIIEINYDEDEDEIDENKKNEGNDNDSDNENKRNRESRESEVKVVKVKKDILNEDNVNEKTIEDKENIKRNEYIKDNGASDEDDEDEEDDTFFSKIIKIFLLTIIIIVLLISGFLFFSNAGINTKSTNTVLIKNSYNELSSEINATLLDLSLYLNNRISYDILITALEEISIPNIEQEEINNYFIQYSAIHVSLTNDIKNATITSDIDKAIDEYVDSINSLNSDITSSLEDYLKDNNIEYTKTEKGIQLV